MHVDGSSRNNSNETQKRWPRGSSINYSGQNTFPRPNFGISSYSPQFTYIQKEVDPNNSQSNQHNAATFSQQYGILGNNGAMFPPGQNSNYQRGNNPTPYPIIQRNNSVFSPNTGGYNGNTKPPVMHQSQNVPLVNLNYGTHQLHQSFIQCSSKDKHNNFAPNNVSLYPSQVFSQTQVSCQEVADQMWLTNWLEQRHMQSTKVNKKTVKVCLSGLKFKAAPIHWSCSI